MLPLPSPPPTRVQVTVWLCGSRVLTAVSQQQACPILHFSKANCLLWHHLMSKRETVSTFSRFFLPTLSDMLLSPGRPHQWALGWDTDICPQDPSQSPDLLSWKSEPSVTFAEWCGQFRGQEILLWSPLPLLSLHKSSVEMHISKASFCSAQGHATHGGAGLLLNSLTMTHPNSVLCACGKLSVCGLSHAHKIFSLCLWRRWKRLHCTHSIGYNNL